MAEAWKQHLFFHATYKGFSIWVKSSLHKAVTDAAHCVEVFGGRADFLAQPAHVGVHGARVDEAVVFTYVAQKLVAGLHAGLIYNTWPSMDGRVFPETPFFSSPWWINFFENPGLAQFDHRIGAYLIAFAVIALWIAGRRVKLPGLARASSNTLLAVMLLQIVLGIVTLVNQVPVALAALHQATAVALFASAVWHAYEVSRSERVQPVASA